MNKVTIRKPGPRGTHRYEVYCEGCNFVISTEDPDRVKRDHESGRAHEVHDEECELETTYEGLDIPCHCRARAQGRNEAERNAR